MNARKASRDRDERVEERDDEHQEQDDAIIGQALKISLGLAAAVALLAAGIYALTFLNRAPREERETELVLPTRRDTTQVDRPRIELADWTRQAGIDWQHATGMEGEKLLPETMGGGVAVFDFDQDGDQDILFVGGTAWPWSRMPLENPRSLCLYANDGLGNFSDVTAEVGLDVEMYGMGPAVGDFDNDGWPDLLVTGVGGNRLFRNVQGKFQDVTEQAGVRGANSDWTTSAVWFDYDNDSRLDLFVCNYVTWSRDLDLSIGFSLTGIGRAYGQPTTFNGTFSYLYHNEGDGTFRDVSEQAGMYIRNPNTPVAEGKALGVSAIDVNHDGWLDLIVANDTVRNYLYLNNKDGTFSEAGVPMGVAFDRNGLATGAMGIDSACYRNDESLAVVIGNFANEPCSLYVSQGPQPPFFDSAMASGIGPVTRLSLTFGMFFADLDLDGRLDVVCSNGHLESEISKVQPNQNYAQPPQYFWNAGSQGSTELVRLEAAEVGEAALAPMVGRGAAYGDFDGDGDIDVVLIANGGQPRLLRNDQQLGNNWLRLKLEGTEANRDAVGAMVTLQSPQGRQARCVMATRSYLSQCELPVTFGLGNHAGPVDVEITWPGGKTEVHQGLALNQLHHIKQTASGQ
jgi:enediyne biosynthesis protein E4